MVLSQNRGSCDIGLPHTMHLALKHNDHRSYYFNLGKMKHLRSVCKVCLTKCCFKLSPHHEVMYVALVANALAVRPCANYYFPIKSRASFSLKQETTEVVLQLTNCRHIMSLEEHTHRWRKYLFQ